MLKFALYITKNQMCHKKVEIHLKEIKLILFNNKLTPLKNNGANFCL